MKPAIVSVFVALSLSILSGCSSTSKSINDDSSYPPVEYKCHKNVEGIHVRSNSCFDGASNVKSNELKKPQEGHSTDRVEGIAIIKKDSSDSKPQQKVKPVSKPANDYEVVEEKVEGITVIKRQPVAKQSVSEKRVNKKIEEKPTPKSVGGITIN